MLEGAFAILAFFAALGSGVMAGTFFAFSNFLMRALARLPAEQGIGAMQAINITVINPLFMIVFLGTAMASALLAVRALSIWDGANAWFLLAGAGIYLIGCFFVTAAFNVPRNNALAVVDPGSADGARRWADFLRSWTAWNHVRTVSCLTATALFILALA